MNNLTTDPKFITLSKQAKDITGQRFGRLVALGPIGRENDGRAIWYCQCDCGNTTNVRVSALRHNTQSCGCYKAEIHAEIFESHGLSGEPIYEIWRHIVERCTKPKNKSYTYYGGRGITICDEWLSDFKAFYDHVSQLPFYGEKGYTIDRVDNSLGYAPGNVRYATHTEQMRNTRTNHLVTYKGKTQCIRQWEDELGFCNGTLHGRLEAGWTVERAFVQPVRKSARRAAEL